MADFERFKTKGDETGDPAKRREELDHLLQRIAAHIAEVDNKSLATGPDASEEGEVASGAAPEAADRDSLAPSDAAGEGPSADDSNRGHQPDQQPPALRSAFADENIDHSTAEASGIARDRSTPGPEKAAQDMEHERADSADRDEPWDHDTAEALTRSYEAGQSIPSLRSMYDLMAQRGSAAGYAGGRGIGSFDASSSAEISHAEIDAAQTRLFEAAQRVEAMLDRLAPREVVEALGDRFDALEGEVRRTGDQLARLDGIESRLGELGQKLTDEQVVSLFGSLVPTAEELTQFAEDAAGRAATRVLEAYARDSTVARPVTDEPSAAVGVQLASLGDLLGRYMDERRRSDTGTLEALETLQLAMQHVLDKIDRAEGSAGPRNEAPGSVGAQHRDARLDAAEVAKKEYYEEERDPLLSAEEAAAELDQPSAGVVNLTANQVGGALDLSAESYSMPEAGLHDPAGSHASDSLAEASATANRQVEDFPAWAHPAEGATEIPAPPAAPMQGVEVDAEEPSLSNDRQMFIAKARQAAERANVQAGHPRKGQAQETRAAKRRKRGIFASGTARGIIRPGVLLVAIAAVAFASWWLLYGQKDGLLRPSALAVEPPQTVASATVAPQPRAAAPADRAPAPPSAADASGGSAAPAAPEGPRQINAAAAASESAGPGMAVSFGNSAYTYDTVVKARERSRLAGLSQRAAYSAVRSYAARDFDKPASPVAPSRAPSHASDTTDIETSSVRGKSAATPAAGGGVSGHDMRHLDLPPAMSGPLSLRMAAAKGDAAAQVEIATRLAEGKGVRQDFAEAAKWYRRAADQDSAVAQYRLATLYERGMGVKSDRAKAQALYEKAAGQGNLKAMHNLAVITASPTAGNPDYTTAARLFERAARHGLRDSQYNLGVLYESGLGVAKDHAAAYRWYALAARSGDSIAARRRDSLIAKLPSQTIQAVDAQIAAWRPESANEAANDARAFGAAHVQRRADAGHR
jgi:localization factor PodJL